MAKILGNSGRYVSEELARQRRIILGVAFAVIALLGLLLGVIMSSFLQLEGLPTWARLAMMSIAIIAIVSVDAWGERKLEAAQRRNDAKLRAAGGELLVGNILINLPDEYHVISEFSTPTGNIDYVVISPKGVFLLDTKNWRGVVAADEHGELVLNGRPTEKPFVSQYFGRVMLVKKEVARCLPQPEVNFHAVIVFTAARLEAKWGSTGNVLCVRDDELQKYIFETKVGKELTPEETQAIVRVFLALAKQDSEYSTAAPTEPAQKNGHASREIKL